MESNVDRFGRVLIPKKVRERLGLGSGHLVDIDVEGNRLLISPKESLSLEKKGKAVVIKGGQLLGKESLTIQDDRTAELIRRLYETID